MDNEFGYVDDKPFIECYKDKQETAIIKTDKNGIEFKLRGIDKFFLFEDDKSISGLYAVDSKFLPITAFRTRIKNNTFEAIPSSTVVSDSYFYKQGIQKENEQIKHFTHQTKIHTIEYYNDSISRAFKNTSFDVQSKLNQKNVLNSVNIKANKKEKQKICSMKIGDNNISIYLKEDFKYLFAHKSPKNITITDNSFIILTFKKGVTVESAYGYVLLLDTLFYLMTLLKRRHKKLFVYDFRSNKYFWRDSKIENDEKIVNDRNFLICNREEAIFIFEKLFKALYILEKDMKNGLFPFWNFDIKHTSLEIVFLEYYKVLEYLHIKKQEKNGKKKNKTFLIEYLKKYEDLRKKFFDKQDIDEIEEERRALRNYYSHEGYYVDELPIPTNKPKRWKKIDYDWLNNVLNFIKTLAYIEIYEACEIKTDWNKIYYNI